MPLEKAQAKLRRTQRKDANDIRRLQDENRSLGGYRLGFGIPHPRIRTNPYPAARRYRSVSLALSGFMRTPPLDASRRPLALQSVSLSHSSLYM